MIEYISRAQNTVNAIRDNSIVPATYVGKTIISATCNVIAATKYVMIFITTLDNFALSRICPRYGAAINPVIVSIAIHSNRPIIAECIFCVNENIAPHTAYIAFEDDHVTLYI